MTLPMPDWQYHEKVIFNIFAEQIVREVQISLVRDTFLKILKSLQTLKEKKLNQAKMTT